MVSAATVVIELAIGMAAQTARRAYAELQRAARLTLPREVQDGAVEVLALVARRGREIGGPTTQLAELAGAQAPTPVPSYCWRTRKRRPLARDESECPGRLSDG